MSRLCGLPRRPAPPRLIRPDRPPRPGPPRTGATTGLVAPHAVDAAAAHLAAVDVEAAVGVAELPALRAWCPWAVAVVGARLDCGGHWAAVTLIRAVAAAAGDVDGGGVGLGLGEAGVDCAGKHLAPALAALLRDHGAVRVTFLALIGLFELHRYATDRHLPVRGLHLRGRARHRVAWVGLVLYERERVVVAAAPAITDPGALAGVVGLACLTGVTEDVMVAVEVGHREGVAARVVRGAVAVACDVLIHPRFQQLGAVGLEVTRRPRDVDGWVGLALDDRLELDALGALHDRDVALEHVRECPLRVMQHERTVRLRVEVRVLVGVEARLVLVEDPDWALAVAALRVRRRLGAGACSVLDVAAAAERALREAEAALRGPVVRP